MSVVTITESAEEQITQICIENNAEALRLDIKGGGCAGFEYEWGTYATPDELQEDDEVFKTDTNRTFVIGKHSLMFLFGTIIDYKKDIMQSMFEISNPNAQSSCGCGVSVNFDMDRLADPAI